MNSTFAMQGKREWEIGYVCCDCTKRPIGNEWQSQIIVRKSGKQIYFQAYYFTSGKIDAFRYKYMSFIYLIDTEYIDIPGTWYI